MVGLAYFIYKKLTSGSRHTDSPNISGNHREAIEDMMVQDPYCKTYFPRREGVPLNVGGENVYFCSKECREKFMAEQS
jgi:YHS domain-containing protein